MNNPTRYQEVIEPTASPASCRLLLADDHTLLRQGVKALIETYGMTVVGEASDGREAVRIAEDTQPDVAILDVMMPFLNGLDVVREIRRVSPNTKSLLLTMHTDVRPRGAEGRRHRVCAQVPTRDGRRARNSRHLQRLVLSQPRRFPDGHSGLPGEQPHSLRSLDDQREGSPATGRPRHDDKKVAGLLGVSVKTAESHRHRIMDKLDLHDIASLVRYSIRRRLIEP
jgi:two-component system response regulator NreC